MRTSQFIFSVLLLLTLSCSKDSTGNDQRHAANSDLDMQLNMAATTIEVASTLEFSLDIHNNSDKPYRLNFADAQRFEFSLENASGITFLHSNDFIYTASPEKYSINPEETLELPGELTLTDKENLSIPAGDYIFNVKLFGDNFPLFSKDISITESGSDLQYTLTLTATTIAAGDELAFTMDVANPGPETINLIFPSSQIFDFWIKNDQGNTVLYHNHFYYTQRIERYDIESQESEVFASEFDLETDKFLPGEYIFKVKLHGDSHPYFMQKLTVTE
jgi:hypothetical protein